jgi:hypothetical protein
MPLKSPFGNERLRVHPIHLLDPRRHQLWFADFYCNTFNHYVTVVVTVRHHFVLGNSGKTNSRIGT